MITRLYSVVVTFNDNKLIQFDATSRYETEDAVVYSRDENGKVITYTISKKEVKYMVTTTTII